MIAEPMIEVTLRVAKSISEVAAEAWDACANPAACAQGNGAAHLALGDVSKISELAEQYNPFISHEFLSSLERSQSVGGRCRLATAAPAGRRRQRNSGRRRPLLREVPFARRIRLRPRLGRGL